jgi:hypothetical protein
MEEKNLMVAATSVIYSRGNFYLSINYYVQFEPATSGSVLDTSATSSGHCKA